MAFATVLTGCAAVSPAPPRACAAVSAPASRSNQRAPRVELVRGDQVACVELDDSSATRELLEQLLLSIELRDSFDLATVASLPTALDTGGASVSCGFLVGEIGYCPADGAIAIFHSAGAAQLRTPGVVLLGRGHQRTLNDHGTWQCPGHSAAAEICIEALSTTLDRIQSKVDESKPLSPDEKVLRTELHAIQSEIERNLKNYWRTTYRGYATATPASVAS